MIGLIVVLSVSVAFLMKKISQNPNEANDEKL
jgi:hypothetical protein